MPDESKWPCFYCGSTDAPFVAWENGSSMPACQAHKSGRPQLGPHPDDRGHGVWKDRPSATPSPFGSLGRRCLCGAINGTHHDPACFAHPRFDAMERATSEATEVPPEEPYKLDPTDEREVCPVCGDPWMGGLHKAFCFGPKTNGNVMIGSSLKVRHQTFPLPDVVDGPLIDRLVEEVELLMTYAESIPERRRDTVRHDEAMDHARRKLQDVRRLRAEGWRAKQRTDYAPGEREALLAVVEAARAYVPYPARTVEERHDPRRLPLAVAIHDFETTRKRSEG